LVELEECVAQSVHAQEHDSLIHKRGEQAGIERQGALSRGHRSGIIPGFPERGAGEEIRLNHTRVESYRLRQFRQRLCFLSAVPERRAQIEPRLGVLRVEPHRLRQMLHSAFNVLGLAEEKA